MTSFVASAAMLALLVCNAFATEPGPVKFDESSADEKEEFEPRQLSDSNSVAQESEECMLHCGNAGLGQGICPGLAKFDTCFCTKSTTQECQGTGVDGANECLPYCESIGYKLAGCTAKLCNCAMQTEVLCTATSVATEILP
eukprot:TRINITY_DN30070_c0_g1_i1.p2 TRINITY_DN30070_c0_g1~~TRINITY_DN30070_c0_g1_i1.p2  ORF type:complete len:142 (-),score=28.67 TRINITY_DN30070_c0_g1_i1:22-447(-)